MRILAVVLLVGALLGCSNKSAEREQTSVFSDQAHELSSIPDADPSKYPNWRDMRDWKNPYLVVRQDGIGFVDLANSEVRILEPNEVPPVLAALPPSAWPYGRVVLLGQAAPKDDSQESKAALRKNRGLVIGTLKELNVQVHESP